MNTVACEFDCFVCMENQLDECGKVDFNCDSDTCPKLHGIAVLVEYRADSL